MYTVQGSIFSTISLPGWRLENQEGLKQKSKKEGLNSFLVSITKGSASVVRGIGQCISLTASERTIILPPPSHILFGTEIYYIREK